MFNRVLIAEDHESANISLRKTLEDLGITNVQFSYYCDDACMHIRKTVHDDEPYDLLITDLSFEEDHRETKIADGAELIQAVRKIRPDLKVIVFSAESKAAVVDKLFKELKINGYVRKARNDAKELKKAIEAIAKNKTYLPDDLKKGVKEKNSFAFTTFDIRVIELLSKGVMQKDIPEYLVREKIKPSGLSSVEKRLNIMKLELECSKNEQLIVICKDLGII